MFNYHRCLLHRLFFLFHKIVLLTGCLTGFAVMAQPMLPTEIESAIAESPLSFETVSIWVAPVDSGIPIVDYQSHIPRTPASITKAITTGISLFLLGENYRWKTEFYTNGSINNTTLDGDLIIKGYGNPYMVEEKLMDMVVELRNLGINHIDGDVILDNSYFINTVETPDSFDGRGLEAYNALPNALSINFRTVELVFNNRGGKINVSTVPELNYTHIQNNMTFNRYKRCRGKGFAPRIEVDRAQDLVVVSGSMSRACKHQTMKKVLSDAGDLFFGNFRKAWLTSGGSMGENWYYGQANNSLTLLYRGLSRPLYEQISAMNKHSNNIMTRQLFLTMGAELTQPPATLEKSRAVVMNKLKQLGIPMQGLFIDNGSGLSRYTKLSAAQMGAFLIAMQDARVRPFFENSLSIVGVDGTLRRRLRGTPLAGNAIGKTGTLKNAKSVVGYLTAQSGRKYAYVMLFEGKRAKAGRGLMDAVMQWVYTL